MKGWEAAGDGLCEEEVFKPSPKAAGGTNIWESEFRQQMQSSTQGPGRRVMGDPGGLDPGGAWPFHQVRWKPQRVLSRGRPQQLTSAVGSEELGR